MNKDSNIPFITWLRASSAILILLCHCCSQCSISFVSMLTLVLNIGVQLFFIMSGFLVGYKGIAKPYTMWYRKRIKRIFIPFWIFLFVLGFVHLVQGIPVFTKDWLLLVFGLQGTVVNVRGAEQTWFLSVLLLCYLLSPMILKLIRKVADSRNSCIRVMAILVVCLMPVVYALSEKAWVYTVFTPVSLYIMSCAYGMFYTPGKQFTTKKILLALLVAGCSFFLRIVIKLICDGTVLYDRITVPYTQAFAACAIVYIFEALCRTPRIPRVVRFVNDVSFEIYLYHYMFVQGPIRLFSYIPNWIIGCAVVTAVVCPVAFCANRIPTAFSKK